MKITEYADIINANIKIIYHHNQQDRWSASFEHAEVKEASMLTSVYGNGDSPKSAIDDYVSQIKGKLLVFNACGKNRREFIVPDFINNK